jgi:hypothetical protein
MPPEAPSFQQRQIVLDAPYFPTSEYAGFSNQPAISLIPEEDFQMMNTYANYTLNTYAVCSNSLPPIPNSVFEDVPWLPPTSYQQQYFSRSTVSGVSM